VKLLKYQWLGDWPCGLSPCGRFTQSIYDQQWICEFVNLSPFSMYDFSPFFSGGLFRCSCTVCSHSDAPSHSLSLSLYIKWTPFPPIGVTLSIALCVNGVESESYWHLICSSEQEQRWALKVHFGGMPPSILMKFRFLKFVFLWFVTCCLPI